jgi:nucleotide-binding universal stress UspA family protein
MYQRILVPVDGSSTSKQGLDEAVKLAKLSGASLRLVHVANELTFATGCETYTGDVIGMLKEAGEQVLSESKTVAMAAGAEVDTVLVETFGGRLCDIVGEQAKLWRADLIVIGTHGRRGIGRILIGSDAEQIVRTALVPVLLVRAPEVKDAPLIARGPDGTLRTPGLVAA